MAFSHFGPRRFAALAAIDLLHGYIFDPSKPEVTLRAGLAKRNLEVARDPRSVCAPCCKVRYLFFLLLTYSQPLDFNLFSSIVYNVRQGTYLRLRPYLVSIPDPIRTRKSNSHGCRQYCGRGPRGNTACRNLFCHFYLRSSSRYTTAPSLRFFFWRHGAAF